jgi:Ribosomal protein L7/L12 C-terminal domain
MASSRPLTDEQVQQISGAIFTGRKIAAIKLYRQATNVGLKESKDFIEALEIRLRQESPGEFTAPPSSAGCLSNAGVLMVAAIMIYLIAHQLVG